LTFLGPCLSRETSDSENLQRSQAIPLNDCFLDANTSGRSISQRTQEETPTDCFLALSLVSIEAPRILLEKMKADYLPNQSLSIGKMMLSLLHLQQNKLAQISPPIPFNEGNIGNLNIMGNLITFIEE